MTVGRLLAEISADELTEWIALAVMDNEAEQEREQKRHLEHEVRAALADFKATRGH